MKPVSNAIRRFLLLPALLLAVTLAGSAAELPASVRTALDSYFEAEWGEGRVHWQPSPSMRRLTLPEGAEIAVAGPGKPRGTVLVQLLLSRNGRLLKKLPLSLRVQAFAWVPVAKETLPRHTVIDESHLLWKLEEVTAVRGEWPRAEDDLAGELWRTRRRILAGSVLCYEDIEHRPEVLMGERVQLVAVRRGVRITAPGLALQDGREGDRIRVESLVNGTYLTGKVRGVATVDVEGVAGRRRGS